MAARQRIPAKLRQQVLAEYSHRCAICGADRPQLHHLDENSANNVPENLIPLCPNCHLSDQHNPTAHPHPGKLLLFRRFKDPTILAPEFDPLFRRIQFLENAALSPDVVDKMADLLDFIRVLEMGQYYRARIERLLEPEVLKHRQDELRDRREWVRKYGGSGPRSYRMKQPLLDTRSKEELQRQVEAYYEQLEQRRERVYELLMELLRYQRWARPVVPSRTRIS